jgi:hypothetical protein
LAVHIDRPGALGALEKVEGPAWRRRQYHDQTNPWGFYAVREAYRALGPGDLGPADVMEPGGLVEGSGGSLYAVRPGGELVLLGWAVTPEKADAARAAGFAVEG